MEVGIVAQQGNTRAQALAADLHDRLREQGVTSRLDAETGSALDRAGVSPRRMRGGDLAVSIGGDGTFLFTAREVGDTPILGINLGEVGFLNAVSPEGAFDAVEQLIKDYRTTGSVATTSVHRLEAIGEDWHLEPALNEIVVQGERRGPGGGCRIEISVDGSYFAGGPADGVLVATPTGSTAYNLSERGPLVHPTVPGVVVTHMCAVDPMPSLVVDIESEIEITIADGPSAYVIGDGRDRQRIEPPTTVRIQRSDEPVRLAGPPVDFFEALGKLD